jgi:mannose/cellobiose epimerase-like protein (N-acyl-D-glucosamine 2-epimerase family)
MNQPSKAKPYTDAQRIAAQRFVSYTFADMAGLWLRYGWNAAGAHSIERLQADRTPARLGYRRSMAVARQLFFMSQAWRVTGNQACAERAHALFTDLTGRFWDAQHEGWFFSLDDAGAGAESGADARKDLYGHAFAIFALSHYAAIFGKPAAIDWARRTSDVVKRRLLLPQGWFAQGAARDWTQPDVALEQNPHMHMLEAWLALHAATGDAGVLQDTEQLIALYTARLRSADGGKVLEHFDAEGRPQQEKGQHVQPGHLYEWYWLLHDYAGLSGQEEYRQVAAPLFDWAERQGVDPEHGGLYDQVDTDGRVVSDRKRIWPVTECIKVHAIRAAATQDAAIYASLDGWIGFIMRHYLTRDGGWHEFLRRDLTPDSDYLPATTPYHVGMAALHVAKAYGDLAHVLPGRMA